MKNSNASIFRRFAHVERAALLLEMPNTPETDRSVVEPATKRDARVVVTIKNVGTSRLVRRVEE